ncbi:MAG: MBL fold metallo-hydrolase [Acidimicrobiia bacterium]|nr:MBL fold metallo-hydrolase [Acidimicrobiia bacterium]
MRLTVLGSNGTYPTPGHPASGYLVTAGATVWVDAGPGTLAALMAISDPGDIDALVLSHGHGDHCLDVFPLFNLLRYGPPRPESLPVFAPEGVAERLAAFIGADAGHAFFQVFDFIEVGPGSTARTGDLRITWGEAVHPVPALVTRIEAGEASMAYSGDTGPGGDLVEMASEVDLLLCEATNQGIRAKGDYPYHLFADEAGQAASAAGASHLLVTHVAPTLDSTVSVREAAAVFEGPVEWAAPGLEVEL